MRKKDRSTSTDPDELAVYLLETIARKDLPHFLEMFRKDFHSKMNFEEGYELLDDDLPGFMPPEHLQPQHSFMLFVRAKRKTGESCRFLIHTIWMGDTRIALGIMEVPDEAVSGNFVAANWN